MKKIIIFFLSIFFLAGCSKENNITMKVKEGTLTPVDATIIITDHSGKHNTYGEWFEIERESNGKWKKQKPIMDNYGFNLIGYEVDENHQLELYHNWQWIYGPLPKGNYRILKKVENDTIYANFTIE